MYCSYNNEQVINLTKTELLVETMVCWLNCKNVVKKHANLNNN